MSALSVQAAVVALAPAPAAVPAASEAAQGSAFSTLLGEMAQPKGSSKTDAKAHDKAAANNADASTSNALLSLEAALNGLQGSPAPAVTPSPATSLGPVSAAPTSAAPPLEGQAWDVSGQTPLKALLQTDASLGVADVKIETFLAVAGAMPTKAGGTELRAEPSARVTFASPGPAQPRQAAAPAATLAPPPSATPAPLATATLVAEAPTTPNSATATVTPPASAPTGPTVGATNAARPAPVPRERSRTSAAPAVADPAQGEAPSATAASTSAHGDTPRRGKDAAAPPEVAPVSAAPSTAAPAVALANLPAFIADQANALSRASAPDARNVAATPMETPKAAQAVKELSISLEPADLGQMTLKLRLAGGKLSVTIAVADPKTLTSIENDRALIAARLGAGDQTLADLVIQRQAPATTETGHGFSSDSGAETADSGANAASAGDRRHAPRGGARGGRAFSDLA